MPQKDSPMESGTSKKNNGGATVNKDGLQQPSVGRAHASKMVGPQWIQTLRGELLGRKVALVCCGEAHEGVLHMQRCKQFGV